MPVKSKHFAADFWKHFIQTSDSGFQRGIFDVWMLGRLGGAET
jgi:hypothetical protein